MVHAVFFLATAIAFHSTVEAATQPKVLGLDFKKTKRELASSLARRQNSATADISNEQIYYQIDVEVGSPGQPFGLQLDTGSSDLWVPLADSKACPSLDTCTLGAFDPEKSETFNSLDDEPDFEISYVDGSSITGAYFTDNVTIGSTSIQRMQMGLADNSPSRDFGIMGIGFQSGESIAETYPDAKYPNIINQLKSQGYIKTLGYSLWLNDLGKIPSNFDILTELKANIMENQTKDPSYLEALIRRNIMEILLHFLFSLIAGQVTSRP